MYFPTQKRQDYRAAVAVMTLTKNLVYELIGFEQFLCY